MNDDLQTEWRGGPVLLTGATGFVGRHLYPRLTDAGIDVRCATRRPEAGRQRDPDRDWVEFDLERPATVRDALEGCSGAYFLVHQMDQGGDYRARERRSAQHFVDAAEESGLGRLVYLGGIEPDGPPSEHLSSRLETGRILRAASFSTIELRASMIVGPGSASWRICRDLAARLPAMVLPAWTASKSEPLYVDDLVEALVGALERPTEESRWYDLPGPEALSVRDILRTIARTIGLEPREIQVPLLSPRLSSYWLKLVSRSNVEMARELVEGLKTDILARDGEFWEIIDHRRLVGFEEMVEKTLAAEEGPSGFARAYEQTVAALFGGGR